MYNKQKEIKETIYEQNKNVNQNIDIIKRNWAHCGAKKYNNLNCEMKNLLEGFKCTFDLVEKIIGELEYGNY